MNAHQFLQSHPDIVASEPLIEGLARVVAVDGRKAWLQTEQPAACGSCATHSVCSGSHSATAGSWQVQLPEDGLDGDGKPLNAGDLVRVGIDRTALAHTSLVAYALPLLTMLVAAVSCQDAGNAVAVVASIAGLLGGAVVAHVLARRWRKALQPLVLGLASDAGELRPASGCSPSTPTFARPVPIPVVPHRSQ